MKMEGHHLGSRDPSSISSPIALTALPSIFVGIVLPIPCSLLWGPPCPRSMLSRSSTIVPSGSRVSSGPGGSGEFLGKRLDARRELQNAESIQISLGATKNSRPALSALYRQRAGLELDLLERRTAAQYIQRGRQVTEGRTEKQELDSLEHRLLAQAGSFADAPMNSKLIEPTHVRADSRVLRRFR